MNKLWSEKNKKTDKQNGLGLYWKPVLNFQ